MKAKEKQLLKYYSTLSEQQQNTLLLFAEFLSQQTTDSEPVTRVIPTPVVIERPAEETVVGAIKRLTASYPMLERSKLFNETSSLMTRHVMQGHDAAKIIDELEALFEKHYHELLSDNPDESDNEQN